MSETLIAPSPMLGQLGARTPSPCEPLSVITKLTANLSLDTPPLDKSEQQISSSPESGIGSSVVSSPTAINASPSSAAAFRQRSMSECDAHNGRLKSILKRCRPWASHTRSMSETEANGSVICSSQASLLSDDSEMSYEECHQLSLSLAHGDALLSFLSSKKSVRFAEKLVHERRYKSTTSILAAKKKNEKRSQARRERNTSGESCGTSASESEKCGVAVGASLSTSDDDLVFVRRSISFSSSCRPLRTRITPIKELPIAELVNDETSALNRLAGLLPTARMIVRAQRNATSDSEDEMEARSTAVVPLQGREGGDAPMNGGPPVMVPVIETAKTRNKRRRNQRRKAKAGVDAASSPTPPPVEGDNGAPSKCVKATMYEDCAVDDNWTQVTSGRRRDSRPSKTSVDLSADEGEEEEEEAVTYDDYDIDEDSFW